MRRRTVLALVAFLCASGAVAVRTARYLDDPRVPGRPHYAMHDFRGAIYYPVRQLLAGENPYAPAEDPEAYPPLKGAPLYLPMTLTLHLPLGLLARRPAEVVFFLATLLAVPALAALALRLCGRAPSAAAVLAIAAVIVLTRPGHMALFAGQSTGFAVLGVYVALLAARSRPWLGGLGLAAACIKPTFGVPLGFLMLWRREARAFVVGAGLVAVLCAPAALLAWRAAGGLGPLLTSVTTHGLAKAEKLDFSEVTSIYRVDAVALLGRFVGRRFGPFETAAITGGVLVAAGWALRRTAARDLRTALVCLAVVACIYHQTYDALLLVAPLTALLTGAWRPESSAVRWLLVVLLAVPAANYLPSYGMLGRLELDAGPARLAVISANGAAIVLALLTTLALAGRRRAPGYLREGGVSATSQE